MKFSPTSRRASGQSAPNELRAHSAYGALVSWLFILCFGFSSTPLTYSAEPEIEGRATNTPTKPERVMVAVTNWMQTAIGFFSHAQMQFPVPDGNNVTILQRKPARPDRTETHSELSVVNINAENFSEILKRLDTQALEMAIYPGTNFVYTVRDRGQPERKVICETGYAVITDTRIPRGWLLFYPKLDNYCSVEAIDVLTAFPLSFRPMLTK